MIETIITILRLTLMSIFVGYLVGLGWGIAWIMKDFIGSLYEIWLNR